MGALKVGTLFPFSYTATLQLFPSGKLLEKGRNVQVLSKKIASPERDLGGSQNTGLENSE